MTNLTQQIETLNSEKRELINQLRGNYKESGLLEQIKAIEQQVQELEFLRLIEQKNAKYSKLRETAKQVFELERPILDIFTNDGYIHKTKGKKYPKLNALEYARFEYKNGFLNSVWTNGEQFRLTKTIYKTGEPDQIEYFATFEEFLKENSIPLNDFKADELKQISEQLTKLNENLQNAIKEYKSGLNSLDSYSLEHWGLLSRRQEYLYKSESNF